MSIGLLTALADVINSENTITFLFVAKYALETPEVADLGNHHRPRTNTNISFDQLNWVSARTVNAICAIFGRDDLSFASGALFLHTKCTPDLATGLATGKSWRANMTICVGISDGPERPRGYGNALRTSGPTASL